MSAVRLAFLTFILSFAAAGFSADPKVEKLLASMRTAYQTPRSVSLEGKAKVYQGASPLSLSYKMSFQRPTFLRLAFDFGGQTMVRICDGKKVYTKLGDIEPMIASISMDTLGGDAPINLESMSFFDYKRQLSTTAGANMAKSEFKLIDSEKWKDKSWVVLEETAKEQGLFVRYFIDPKTFYIWRCEVQRLDGKKPVIETELTKLILDPKLDKKLFQAPVVKK